MNRTSPQGKVVGSAKRVVAKRLNGAPRQGPRRYISIGIYEAGIGCRKNCKGDL